MIARQLLVTSIAAALSIGASGQCVSGEKDPVESRTRKVVAPDGRGVADAQVAVFDASKKLLFKMHLDSHGKFSIPDLKPDESQWLYDKNLHVEVDKTGFIRYRYLLLPYGNSPKVKSLILVPASSCHDMKLTPEEDSDQ